MTKREELRLLDEATARDARRPARDRFRDMVAHGVVDESGRPPMGGGAADEPAPAKPGRAGSRSPSRGSAGPRKGKGSASGN